MASANIHSLLNEAENQVASVSDLVNRKRQTIEQQHTHGRPPPEADQRELATLLSIKAAHEAHRNELKNAL
jgi:hypothetical protein